jgi:hypothetical protein
MFRQDFTGLVLDEDHAVIDKVRGPAMNVQRTLGPGFLESIYPYAFAYKLRRAGLTVEIGQRISVRQIATADWSSISVQARCNLSAKYRRADGAPEEVDRHHPVNPVNPV